MRRLVTLSILLGLLALAPTAQAQRAACIERCDKVEEECKEPCRQEAITAQRKCEEAGGSVAACQASYDNTYTACLSRTGATINECTKRQGCEKCFGRWGEFYCACGSPFEDDLSCQYDSTGCQDCTPDDGTDWQNCYNLEAQWTGSPTCDCSDPSPILIDVLGNGFDLTNRADGVEFDLNGDGKKNRLPWTKASSDDAWLVLDRNRDGVITTGSELFGSFTPQPNSPSRNGFLALAEYDQSAYGGNNDGVIDQRDRVFAELRLWQDINHNGISESVELVLLQSVGIAEIELAYKESKYVDANGNEFRYRAKVKDVSDSRVARWAWDVFFAK